jgi:hydroxylaminobenzene mutase
MSSLLCFSGVLLFVLGLFTGLAIPVFRSPRIGLSAHLTGVQSGTFLIASGLLWPRLALGAWSAAVGHGLWLSLYAIWLSLVLAAMFGAGRLLPIAGGGISAARPKELVVSVLMGGGSLCLLVASAAVLIDWRWV